MKIPALDNRTLRDVRDEVARLAHSYTPEWRFESASDDPGAALAELFSTMFHETVDRVNALPEKLYIEFLNVIGYREPSPAPARGTMRFTPHATVAEPVTVPAGTRVFTPDAEGVNVVYETVRTIQASSAVLTDVYYAEEASDSIRRLDFGHPQNLFSAQEGEELQKHSLRIGQNRVLRLDCPAEIDLELRTSGSATEITELLVKEGLSWRFLCQGEWIPFDEARAEHGRIVLSKRNRLSPEADEAGHICLYCEGKPPLNLTLDQTAISSRPLQGCPAQRIFSADEVIDPAEGGYCFGRRPAPYSLFYLRSDTVLSKRGAKAMLQLEIDSIVDAPASTGPEFHYGPPIIDKRGAVAAKPDDVFVSRVVWEYYNGVGWRSLENVTGNKNPFSGKAEGPLKLVFPIPEDLEETEVNAETGLYIRARVVEVENQFSVLPKWIIPFLRSAEFQWQYGDEERPRADYIYAENNGEVREIPDAGSVTRLELDALRAMDPEGDGVYLRFSASPHGYPLSLRFRMEGRTRIGEKLIWEALTENGFELAQYLDGTENLLHSGEVFLYLGAPLPEARVFGQSGYWLRLRRTGRGPAPTPRVQGIDMNTVTAVQYQREAPQFFEAGVYDVEKSIRVLNTPVLDCRVWVDELSRLSEEEARSLAAGTPDRVRLEEEDHRVTRCWVLWEQRRDLALAGPEDRVYMLDPWSGEIRFGDDVCGRVPPDGDRNIRVEYASGGGPRGNVPAGAVNALLGALPRISGVENITPMSGGTGRLTLEEIEDRGSRRLRHRWRAAGEKDFEYIVLDLFPQVRHVRCISGRDARGQERPGDVTVVIDAHGEQGEALEDLCREIYAALADRCSCCLVAEKRLHVRAATLLTVNTTVTVTPEWPDQAAQMQQEIAARLAALVDATWRTRPIGEQIRLDEIWRTVRETEGVRLVRRILVEGVYDIEGQKRIIPLENDGALPYAVVQNGTHMVRLQ